ncbi:2-hydroxyacid dehydrogenase [Blastopirellula marina]|uniref:Hydroxyacid dehydrogenase n=1 Tax=Blastopirellula marina TaxID=124 RepID=A0A2S8FNV0_9BACT|nr:2-hydroxyacid dehydrogenase [Blastopirellula marina]PQO33544.1 hydroxyacid dehydrogenase [Blastopirellula marina]PTL43331.1 2-hydroxyacid dehydrogenase [Blastopirellula marina]
MKVAVFGTKSYDRQFLEAAAKGTEIQWHFFEPRLTETTVPLAHPFPAICCFVNDMLGGEVLSRLAEGKTRMIAMRCAGYNNVDLAEAKQLGIQVARVPAYSPYAVAEHAVGLILTLNRKYHKAYNRVREGNFSIEGLLGFDLHGKTVGVIGTGKIGQLFAQIMHGFGCHLLAYDVQPAEACTKLGAKYVSLDELFAQSDIISLHCPLLPATKHLIDDDAIAKMKPGVMVINTSRGALINTKAAIEGLKSGRIGYLGIDVYEEEADLFFENKSETVIQDDVFARLMTFPNVLVTGHQAFFTENALEAIAEVTVENLQEFAAGKPLTREVKVD